MKLRDSDFKDMKLSKPAREELARIRKETGSTRGPEDPITGEELSGLLRKPRQRPAR